MRRRSALALLACVLIVTTSLRAQVGLLTIALPSPGDVIKLIDTLTKSDSDTSVNVKLGKTVTQGKLLVARTKVQVAMERSSKNWRGKVLVHMTVPTEISYSIELTELKAEHIRLDQQRGQVIFTMPAPKVEDVTPMLNEVKADNNYKAARFKLFDKDTSRELQNTMLLHDYQARARKEGQSAIPQIRAQAKQSLQQFLEKLLQGTASRVQVVVE
jgi:hypothetical protein